MKVGTKIEDEGEIKIISRMFTISQLSIDDETQSKGEQIYVEFEGYGGDMSLSYIKQNCKILD